MLNVDTCFKWPSPSKKHTTTKIANKMYTLYCKQYLKQSYIFVYYCTWQIAMAILSLLPMPLHQT